MKHLNISRLFYNKTFCQVFSIIGAIIIWATVTLTVKTDSEKIIRNVPIDFSVEGTAVAALGLSTFDHSEDAVDITLSGSRGALNSVTKEDFLVTLSVGRVTTTGKHTVYIDVNLRDQNKNLTVIDYSPKSIQVNFDKLAIKTLPITTDISNLSAKNEFMLDKGYPAAQEVTISGPESVIGTVSSCVAKINDRKKDMAQTATFNSVPLILLDETGKAVESESISFDKDSVDISVPVLKIKKLPIAADFINKPSNFTDSEFAYTLSLTEIEVAGPVETIDTMSQLYVRYVDLKSVKPGDVVTLDIELPSGFINIANITSVDVTIPSNNMQQKNFTVNQFKFISAPEDKEFTLVTKKLSNVTLVGERTIINSITAQDIVIEVDFSAATLSSGVTTLPATITVPNKKGVFWAYGNYEVVVRSN
ncbi:MAG: hypothetical protein IJ027_06635 [Oscillospiraceae bacterium]|nr:hypothetical protein [Oscillospiraceae bacterium]